MTDKELMDMIEKAIDERGLTVVVDTVCQVCYAKADHIMASYQDEVLAAKWNAAGMSLVNPRSHVKFPS